MDALEHEEITKDRIDILFSRYGILFRELLAGELPDLRWSRIFRRLRLMELSGEIYSGRFFDQIPGIQFISPEALRQLRDQIPRDHVYWLNACDPASLCGIGVDALKSIMPRRLPTSHLVFHGSRLVLVSRRLGKELEINTPPEKIGPYLGFFRSLMNRSFQPLKKIRVDRINSVDSIDSPYLHALLDFGFTLDYRTLTLHASYT
jgi:ATP-dependent Lhr-like helicase